MSKFYGGLVCIMFLSLLLAVPAVNAEEGVTDAEVVIGQCAALEGPASGLGKGMNIGVKAYFDEVNKNGGIGGKKIKFVASDDGYEPDKCVDCTLDMIENQKVFALAGYVGTPTAKAALPVVQEMKVPLVGLFTGAMLLRNPVSRYIFNVRASYDDETEAIVERLTQDLNIKKIAVFYQDDAFGLAGLNGTEKALKKRGMEIVCKGTFARNTEAIKTGLSDVMTGKPEAVVMVGPYKPIAAFVKESKTSGLNAILATISFVGTESLINELGGAANGIIVSQVVPSPDDTSVPIVKDFHAALKNSSPNETPSYVKLEGYVSAKVLGKAIEKAGAAITREGLIDTLESMSNVDIGGISISYSKDNHQGLNKVFITQISNEKAKVVTKVAK